MSWSDSVERANQTFLSTWGASASLLPQDGSGPFPFTGVFKNPGLQDELLTGGAQGTVAPRFWVDYTTISPQPLKGDQVQINCASYDIVQVEVDIEGGAILKLRKNA